MLFRSPRSGYNVNPLYIDPGDDPVGITTDTTQTTTDDSTDTTDVSAVTPDKDIEGYLTGDGIPPNGWPCGSGTSFPSHAVTGDFFLRLDYLPTRLFRFDGKRWVKMEDNVRTTLTPGPNSQTQLSIFVNNTERFVNAEGQTLPVRQALSKVFTPKADN